MYHFSELLWEVVHLFWKPQTAPEPQTATDSHRQPQANQWAEWMNEWVHQWQWATTCYFTLTQQCCSACCGVLCLRVLKDPTNSESLMLRCIALQLAEAAVFLSLLHWWGTAVLWKHHRKRITELLPGVKKSS